MNALREPDYVCTLERIPPEARCELRFNLIYDGPLPSDNRSKSQVETKSEIRRQFSPQLWELWRTDKLLKRLNIEQINEIANEHRSGDVGFVPLVRKAGGMLCRLDISVLARQEPYKTTFVAGDLDNRIKTLIDGLRMPRQLSEHVGDDGTLFCLLEDDSLIAEFSVRCDQLLAPKRSDQVERDIVATITVEVLNVQNDVVMTIGGNPFALNRVTYG